MESNWVEYKCKSGETLCVYNKVTVEHKWPTNNSTEEGHVMIGQSVIYKELNTIGTQTDDNGCDNGCTSMYITASQSLENTEITTNEIRDKLDVESAVHHGLDGFGNGEKNPQSHSEDDNGCTSVSITGCHCLENTEISTNEIEDNLDVESAVHHGLYVVRVPENPQSRSEDDNGCTSVYITGTHSLENTEMSTNVMEGGFDVESDVDHGLDNIVRVEKNLQSHREERNFDCSICNRRFTTNKSLQLHIKVHTEKNLLECCYCQKKFQSKLHLDRHVQAHTGEKSFECSYCKKRFGRKSTLQEHIRRHTGKNLFECSICKKTFTTKGNLNCHIRTHTGGNLVECSICKKTFTTIGSLNYHIRTHTGERPFKCLLCEKKFAIKKRLKIHMRSHTGEKPFECPTCKKAFSIKGNLKCHIRTHTGEKPFECSYCNMKFKSKRTLQTHLRTHTGV